MTDYRDDGRDVPYRTCVEPSCGRGVYARGFRRCQRCEENVRTGRNAAGEKRLARRVGVARRDYLGGRDVASYGTLALRLALALLVLVVTWRIMPAEGRKCVRDVVSRTVNNPETWMGE